MESPISTKAAILASLADESASYGSAIMDHIDGVTEGKMTLHSGSVYPALVSLEKEGLIRRRKDIVATTLVANRSCFYELTKKGREVLDEHRKIAAAVFFTSVFGNGVATGMAYNPL